MGIIERMRFNSTLANQVFFNARANRNTEISSGTPIGIDPFTGRVKMLAGDGLTATINIAASSQLGKTASFTNGVGWNAGYNDGSTAV